MKYTVTKEFMNDLISILFEAYLNDTDTMVLEIDVPESNAIVECEITFSVKKVENDKTS